MERRAECKARHGNGNGFGLTTAMAVALWSTPRTEGFDAGRHRGRADSLHSAVKLLPTPTNHDHQMGGTPTTTRSRNGSPPLNDQMAPNGKLSAAWVAAMMGFPEGWTDVSSTPGATDGRTG